MTEVKRYRFLQTIETLNQELFRRLITICLTLGLGCQPPEPLQNDSGSTVTSEATTTMDPTGDTSGALETTGSKPSICGDEVVDEGESCDYGFLNGQDGYDCTDECDFSKCGDGHRGSAEECDDGNNTNGDNCSSTCWREECGNGLIQPPHETCDDGNVENGDGCSATCLLERCGDDLTEFEEGCDDGNLNPNDFCNPACKQSTCGDGYVWAEMEQCDDANNNNTDDCLDTCVLATCGDGFVHEIREACDTMLDVDCNDDCTGWE